ncbi:hypothetical protein EUTSA_v10001162mg [Eutrema salsugineum]|uniref:FBD domain-containing protein n=1 Tax=Eutrema salsugineum TaxID=72664 RepID=V4KNY3_EUTSA|nr:hypothetical protein EUTSA_v10001162mg [Eutrema salsugineum]
MASYDRISELPDFLLTQILLNLPTKDSVKTSILSKRWEFVWLSVPGLDLKVKDFPLLGRVFESFLDRFMEFNQESRMQKFKIHKKSWDYIQIEEYIGTAVDRGIQHLDVETDIGHRMPHNFYKSKTLVSLKLVTIGIKDPQFVVSLPCLKIMHLEDIGYGDEPLIMEKLISGCPVLEDLTVIKRNDFCEALGFLRVRSQTLKRFRLTFKYGLFSNECLVEIDAPRLEYLKFNHNQSDTIVVKNLNSLSMIDIETEFVVKFGGSTFEPYDQRKRDTIRDFLTGISSVRHMIISQFTLEFYMIYPFISSCRLSTYILDLDQSPNSLTYIVWTLCSLTPCCPNLKILILDLVVSQLLEQIELSYVPQCLISTLECVEINIMMVKEEVGTKLYKYFLENSAVLKKLTIQEPLIMKMLVSGCLVLKYLLVVRNLDDIVVVLLVNSQDSKGSERRIDGVCLGKFYPIRISYTE